MLALWQPELNPDEKLFSQKILIIGVKPPPAELNDNF